MADRVVLITGAARRIGASIARYFHAKGHNIIAHYHHSDEEANSLAAEMNDLRRGSAHAIRLDLRRIDEFEAFAEKALALFGHIDTLVHNASVFFPTPIESLNEQDWLDLVDTNLKAPLFLSKPFGDVLARRGGSIINIVDAHLPLKNHAIYSASKAGLSMLTRSLALELSPDVRVNAIAPGAILWPEDQAEMNDNAKQAYLSRVALGRSGSPDDIAAATYFLATSATYITGQVIHVDGGRHMM